MKKPQIGNLWLLKNGGRIFFELPAVFKEKSNIAEPFGVSRAVINANRIEFMVINSDSKETDAVHASPRKIKKSKKIFKKIYYSSPKGKRLFIITPCYITGG